MKLLAQVEYHSQVNQREVFKVSPYYCHPKPPPGSRKKIGALLIYYLLNRL